MVQAYVHAGVQLQIGQRCGDPSGIEINRILLRGSCRIEGHPRLGHRRKREKEERNKGNLKHTEPDAVVKAAIHAWREAREWQQAARRKHSPTDFISLFLGLA